MTQRASYKNGSKFWNIVQNLGARRFTFLLSFAVVFGASFSLLYTIGFVPESYPLAQNGSENALIARASASEEQGAAKDQEARDVVPSRIVIESVGIDTVIQNPPSTDINVLDQALLLGAVHYPGSGFLNSNSNLFLFGHSSYLPAVNNKNFKAFNHLEKVKIGETIRVESSDSVNLYRVDRVKLISADEALVELSTREKKLTLSTCNSFGNPGERFVVEASFLGSYRL